MPTNGSIGRGIARAFEVYDPTLKLLGSLVRKRSNAQEVVLLSCARLDSLANLGFSDSQKNTFVRFVEKHSHVREMSHISAPDLFRYLVHKQWILPGTIPVAGRFHVFDLRDMPFFSFLWNCGVAVTRAKINDLLNKMTAMLRSRFRILPRQRNGSTIVSVADITAAFRPVWKNAGLQEADAEKAVNPLLVDYRVSALLYSEFRCGAIHEYGVGLDEGRFFSESGIYFAAFGNPYLTPPHILSIQFPAKFLCRLLGTCIRSYRSELLHTKKLPFSMYEAVCDFQNDLQYLDDRSVPLGRDISLALSR